MINTCYAVGAYGNLRVIDAEAAGKCSKYGVR